VACLPHRCLETLLCGHRCFGLCGEWPCPPCPLCHPILRKEVEAGTQLTFSELFAGRAKAEEKWRLWLEGRWFKQRPGRRPQLPRLSPDQTLYMLPECGCVMLTGTLELHLLGQVQWEEGQGQATAIKLLECPLCRTRIFTAMRFERLVKHQQSLYQALKRQLLPEGSDGLSIDRAALAVVLNADLQAGRWFACPRGHPYRLEAKADSAVLVARCPSCSEFIGASKGNLLTGNRFLSLDAEEPAYKAHGMKKVRAHACDVITVLLCSMCELRVGGVMAYASHCHCRGCPVCPSTSPTPFSAWR
jgi:hypothetical protein